MRASLVARNYAETLVALAQRQAGDAVAEFGDAIDAVVELLEREPRVRAFFESPSITPEAKQRALRASFEGRVPPQFLRFLLVVVEKRRERQLREIARAYHDLVDAMLGRVRAEITLPEAADPTLQDELVAWLERRTGKKVVPQFTTDPGILGGVVVRVDEEVLDGSVRRNLSELRRRMLGARVTAGAGA
jgi:F-type H+-transporting ATPase subunit delta